LFGREHKKLYGYSSADEVESVNARIRALIMIPKARLLKTRLQSGRQPSPIFSRRMSLLGSWQRVPVYNREDLVPGTRGKGPCIIEEYDSTTIVGRNWDWKMDPYHDLDLAIRASAKD